MRIGIDAQMLCRNLTGIGRYASEVIKQMVRLYPQIDFHVYAPYPLSVDLGQFKNLTVKTAHLRFKGAGILWSQISLPKWASQDKLDALWVPTHRMPRLLSKKIARVVTIHDLVWMHAGETMHPLNFLAERLLMPDAVRLADRIVADSKSTADALAKAFPFTEKNTEVVYLGPTTFSSAKQRDALLKFGIDRPYFLFVGTLEPRKNLPRLLRAYAALEPLSRRNILLVISGGRGWGNQDLVALIEELNLKDEVRLTGYVNEEMLGTLYRHARFLAMPSLYEGFGLPILESMSFGVPVLTSLCSSLPEVAGDAGLLIDPFSIDSIRQGLSKLILDDELLEQLAGRTKQNVLRFDWEKTAKGVMVEIEKAILERRNRGRLG